MENQERRFLNGDIEIRSIENKDEMPIVVGYALKFNRSSQNIFGFEEILDPHCLDEADMSNVVALINHDMNMPLARTGNNLNLEIDDIGLKFTFKPTKTSYSQDLIENMRAGIINKCSFAFTIADEKGAQTWDDNGETVVRTIFKIDKLYDVSIVTTPAYEDTEAVISQRGLNALKEMQNHKMELEKEKIKLDLMVNG